jgi:hypothetical protein
MTEKTSKGRELSRGDRLQVMLSDEELTVVDNFRFANRMPSRAAAVRELLRRGIEAAGYVMEQGGRSSEYGVISSRPVKRRNKADSN